jgi:MFS transporter, DHA1 family, inner membrane transport protein
VISGKARKALLALAVGGFAIGTGEFVMLGLLPQVAGDLSVSIPRAGQLIAAYALGVVVGAPLLTAAMVRYRRKPVLIVLMSWFAVGNLLSALAPGFGLVMVARFATGLPHGAFFGAGAVVAGSMVDRSRRNTAMAVMFAGLTVANIVGVPLTTIIGQDTSWRLVYALVGVIGVLAVAAIVVAVPSDVAPPPPDGASAAPAAEPSRERTPPDPARPESGFEPEFGSDFGSESESEPRLELPEAPRAPQTVPSLRAELRAFRRAEVWLVLGIAMLGGGGLFATFSYIAPMMTHIAGYADSSVTWLLVLFGLGMTVGNLVGARLSDRFPAPTLLLSLLAEIAVALVFLAADHNRFTAAVMIFLFPLTALAGLPILQGRVISLAGGAPNLAAASIQAAFNIANSLGASLGGLAIAEGFGYGSPNAVAAVLVTLGLGLAVAATVVERREKNRTDALPDADPGALPTPEPWMDEHGEAVRL